MDAALVRLLLKDDTLVHGDIVCDLDGFENFGENSRALNVHLRVLTATSGVARSLGKKSLMHCPWNRRKRTDKHVIYSVSFV